MKNSVLHLKEKEQGLRNLMILSYVNHNDEDAN